MTAEHSDVLLLGIVGSRAYGMAGPDSDTDRLGVYAAPTLQLHGLHPPTGKRATRHSTDPDVTVHEASKFAALCLSGNPTVMELLWLPDELYEVCTPLGEHAIAIRSHFLSAHRVRGAYLGYAEQQFKRLTLRGRFPDVPVGRIEKHARHLLRLIEQGAHLWATGQLDVRVPDPDRVFDFGRRVGAGDIEAAQWVMTRARETFDRVPTVLPDSPDERAVEAWLHDVRAAHYAKVATETPLVVKPYMAVPGTPRAVLVDVDGTVALLNGRNPYDETRVSADLPNTPVIETVRALADADHYIVFMSGRTEGCWALTEAWLIEHVGARWAIGLFGERPALHMRAAGDTRPDHVVKLELFNQHVRHRYDVRVVLDDRNSVVKLWRSLGLTCLQVADGDF